MLQISKHENHLKRHQSRKLIDVKLFTEHKIIDIE